MSQVRMDMWRWCADPTPVLPFLFAAAVAVDLLAVRGMAGGMPTLKALERHPRPFSPAPHAMGIWWVVGVLTAAYLGWAPRRSAVGTAGGARFVAVARADRVLCWVLVAHVARTLCWSHEWTVAHAALTTACLAGVALCWWELNVSSQVSGVADYLVTNSGVGAHAACLFSETVYAWLVVLPPPPFYATVVCAVATMSGTLVVGLSFLDPALVGSFSWSLLNMAASSSSFQPLRTACQICALITSVTSVMIFGVLAFLTQSTSTPTPSKQKLH